MNTDRILTDFREKVSSEISVLPEGVDRYRIVTPFAFDDGDGLVLVLRRVGAEWQLTDEAHTLMRLTYDIDEADLHRGSRQKLIANALDISRVEERDGELVLPVPEERFGDALFSFVQALLRVSDISYLSREQVRSAFREDSAPSPR